MGVCPGRTGAVPDPRPPRDEVRPAHPHPPPLPGQHEAVQPHDEGRRHARSRQETELSLLSSSCVSSALIVRLLLFFSAYASTSLTTRPCTSVSRKSRPAYRKVNFSWSNPSRCR